MAQKIPGIDKPLTKRQRAAAEDRVGEVPFMYRFAFQAAIQTGYIPDIPARLLLDNADKPAVAAVLDELCAL